MFGWDRASKHVPVREDFKEILPSITIIWIQLCHYSVLLCANERTLNTIRLLNEAFAFSHCPAWLSGATQEAAGNKASPTEPSRTWFDLWPHFATGFRTMTQLTHKNTYCDSRLVPVRFYSTQMFRDISWNHSPFFLTAVTRNHKFITEAPTAWWKHCVSVLIIHTADKNNTTDHYYTLHQQMEKHSVQLLVSQILWWKKRSPHAPLTVWLVGLFSNLSPKKAKVERLKEWEKQKKMISFSTCRWVHS